MFFPVVYFSREILPAKQVGREGHLAGGPRSELAAAGSDGIAVPARSGIHLASCGEVNFALASGHTNCPFPPPKKKLEVGGLVAKEGFHI